MVTAVRNKKMKPTVIYRQAIKRTFADLYGNQHIS